MLQPRAIQSSLGIRDKIFSFDYVLVFWKDLGLSAMGPQKLIKHMTSSPGSHRHRLRFVFGIERSASTERPLPGEAFSFAEKIGDPSRPGNQDFTGFTVPAKGIHM